MSTIEKGSDLLPLKQVEALDPKALKDYQEKAAAFVKTFNDAFPDGKVVVTPIKEIVVSETGRVNFVIGKVEALSTQSVGLPDVVVDRIAENLGCKQMEGLIAVHHSTVEPLKLKMTVKAVNAGDKYSTKDGEERTYKVAAIVKVEGTREEVVLSEDAADIIAEMQKEALKAMIMGGSRRSRKPAKAATATTTAGGHDDEADV